MELPNWITGRGRKRKTTDYAEFDNARTSVKKQADEIDRLCAEVLENLEKEQASGSR